MFHDLFIFIPDSVYSYIITAHFEILAKRILIQYSNTLTIHKYVDHHT